MFDLRNVYWHALMPCECICWLYQGDLKNIFVVDSNDLWKRRKSLGKVEISILRGFISELSPIRIGLAERGHADWRAEMML